MQIESFFKELEDCHVLETAIKEHSMVYAAWAKERTAKLFKQPLDTYYDYPYCLWSEVDKRSEELRNAMSRDWKTVEDWSGRYVGNLDHSEWVDLYMDWLAQL